MKFSKKNIPKFPCQISSLSISCWGCCGNDFSDERAVMRDVEENSFEFFEKYGAENSDEKKKEFRDRFPSDVVSPSGICFNLVKFKSGCLACPLHKNISDLVKDECVSPKNDLREGHCDVNYECATFKAWKIWSDEKKLIFLNWILEKKFSNYKYSILNGNDEMVKLFERENLG